MCLNHCLFHDFDGPGTGGDFIDKAALFRRISIPIVGKLIGELLFYRSIFCCGVSLRT
jgi:hypothetical protein